MQSPSLKIKRLETQITLQPSSSLSSLLPSLHHHHHPHSHSRRGDGQSTLVKYTSVWKVKEQESGVSSEVVGASRMNGGTAVVGSSSCGALLHGSGKHGNKQTPPRSGVCVSNDRRVGVVRSSSGVWKVEKMKGKGECEKEGKKRKESGRKKERPFENGSSAGSDASHDDVDKQETVKKVVQCETFFQHLQLIYCFISQIFSFQFRSQTAGPTFKWDGKGQSLVVKEGEEVRRRQKILEMERLAASPFSVPGEGVRT